MHSVAVIASVFALAIEVDLVGCWLVVGGMGSHETIEQFLPAIRFSLLNLLMDDMVLFSQVINYPSYVGNIKTEHSFFKF
jgi:hypothetical protein